MNSNGRVKCMHECYSDPTHVKFQSNSRSCELLDRVLMIRQGSKSNRVCVGEWPPSQRMTEIVFIWFAELIEVEPRATKDEFTCWYLLCLLWHSAGVTVNCLSQLVEVLEIMIETLGGESSLIIMEGLSALLLTQKVGWVSTAFYYSSFLQ